MDGKVSKDLSFIQVGKILSRAQVENETVLGNRGSAAVPRLRIIIAYQ